MRHVLRLPYPPSINNYWIASGNRRFISKRGRDFKLAVQEYIAVQQLQSFGGANVTVDIVIRPRDARLLDVDNPIKPILDSLQDAGMFDNDRQVVCVSSTRGLVLKGVGGCIVVVSDENVPPNSQWC